MAEHTVSLETARLNLAKENPALLAYIEARAGAIAVEGVARYLSEAWRANNDAYTMVGTVWQYSRECRSMWLGMLPDSK